MEEIDCKNNDCKYRSENGGRFFTCDYIIHTGHMRGCKIDPQCIRYIPGMKNKTWNRSWGYVHKLF